MDVAKEALEGTPVGAQGTIRPPSYGLQDLEGFQAVVLEADRLSAAGLIHIVEKHRESWSGQRFVDAIRFRRLG